MKNENVLDADKPVKMRKPSGRRRGRPTSIVKMRTEALAELIKRNYPEYDPVLSMVGIACDMNNEPSIRLQASKEVAKYVRPQLKAIALSVEEQKHEDLLTLLE